MGYKPCGYLILVLMLSKNESMMLFTVLMAYRTYCCICLGANMWFFWKNRKNWPFWRHFYSSERMTNGFMMTKVCKSRWHNNLEKNGKNGCAKLICFVHTPIFPQFVPFFAHFRGRKIQMSKCLRLIPFPISQLSPLNEKSRSTYISVRARG